MIEQYGIGGTIAGIVVLALIIAIPWMVMDTHCRVRDIEAMLKDVLSRLDGKKPD